jgi:hypothetical protein
MKAFILYESSYSKIQSRKHLTVDFGAVCLVIKP